VAWSACWDDLLVWDAKNVRTQKRQGARPAVFVFMVDIRAVQAQTTRIATETIRGLATAQGVTGPSEFAPIDML